MSAIRSLTGGKRTWRGLPISVEHDTKRLRAQIEPVQSLARNDLVTEH
jgi:hypothetical protein